MASWSTGASGGGVDATYGQRSVFGAVGHGVMATAPAGDADLECEDEQAALAYLEGVQAEARKIPHVVLAPAYGPQAFPPSGQRQRRRQVPAAASTAEAVESSATINKKRRRRRRLRHWDELDSGVGGGDEGDLANGDGRTSKRRRMAAPATAAALSYDDDADAGVTTTTTTASTTGYGGRTVRTYAELDTETGSEETDGGDDGSDDDDGDGDDDDTYEPRLDRGIYDNGVGDARGYYQDGAYIAAAAAAASDAGERSAGEDRTVANDAGPGPGPGPDDAIPAAYRVRLLAHFAALRTLLRRTPPAAAVAALPPDHDTAVGTLSGRSGVFRRWRLLLQTTDPLPVQVAALDTVAVLRVLRVLQRGGFLLGEDGSPTPRTSRWLWALLARLPARGELDHRAVGCLRDVAKQVVQRLADDGQGGQAYGPANDETAAQEEEEEEDLDLDLDDLDIAMDLESLPDEDEDEGGGSKETAAAGAHDDSKEQQDEDDNDGADDLQQRATLEMVLAVVGEFYGQRDLLAFRAWP